MSDEELGLLCYSAWGRDVVDAPRPTKPWSTLSHTERACWIGVARAVHDAVRSMSPAPAADVELRAELAAARADAKAAHERTRIVNEAHLAAFRALGGR